MTTVAYSYVRFSTPEQKKGDSYRRQTEKASAYCSRRGWTLDESLKADLGVSAWKGRNALVGGLREFLDRVDSGEVKPGSALIVESVDRISRQGIDEGYDLCKRILKAGVRIVTLTPEREYGPEAVKRLIHGALELQLILERAAEESEIKSERLSAAWAAKKAKARDGVLLTRTLPSWLRAVGYAMDNGRRVGGRVEVIPEKAEVVRLVFRLATEGYGNQRIVSKLVTDGVPPLGDGPWEKGYVGRVLRDRRAVGEYQPLRDVKPHGPPVPLYFPAVVTEAEYAAARAGAARRKNLRDRVGRPALNVFAKLLKDVHGSTYVMNAWKYRGSPYYVLTQLSGVTGRERAVSFPYYVFERAVFTMLREIDPAVVLGTKREGPDPVDVLEGRLADLEGEIGKVKARVRERYTDALAEVLEEHEATRKALAAELEGARAAASVPVEVSWSEARDLAALLADADDPEDVRLRLRTVLRRVVTGMTLLVVPKGRERFAAVQVDFHGGAKRHYWLYYRPALSGFGGVRPGRWAVRSWTLGVEPDLAKCVAEVGEEVNGLTLPAVLRGEVRVNAPDWPGAEGVIPHSAVS
jgi:DNA invertase Pin-like site-specific DNA recombinase